MEMKKVLVAFIQDRSGSMATVWDETLSGFKVYVDGLKADQKKDNEVEYLFSLTTFDTQIETPYIGRLLDDVDGNELKKHGPRGGTALYDAVGKTLQAIDDDKKITFDKAIVVIVTDGEENSSCEWSKEALHAAIDERIKRGNWTFTYLGTQPETWDAATSLGVGVGASAVYDPTNAHGTYVLVAGATMGMARSARAQSTSFLTDNMSKAQMDVVGLHVQDDDPVVVGVAPAPAAPKPVQPRRPAPAKKNSRWR